MDTSKITDEEDSQLRFRAWLSNVESSISDARAYADCFLSSAVGDEFNWDYVRLAMEYHDKSLHLERVKADAIAALEIQSKKK